MSWQRPPVSIARSPTNSILTGYSPRMLSEEKIHHIMQNVVAMDSVRKATRSTPRWQELIMSIWCCIYIRKAKAIGEINVQLFIDHKWTSTFLKRGQNFSSTTALTIILAYLYVSMKWKEYVNALVLVHEQQIYMYLVLRIKKLRRIL